MKRESMVILIRENGRKCAIFLNIFDLHDFL